MKIQDIITEHTEILDEDENQSVAESVESKVRVYANKFGYFVWSPKLYSHLMVFDSKGNLEDNDPGYKTDQDKLSAAKAVDMKPIEFSALPDNAKRVIGRTIFNQGVAEGNNKRDLDHAYEIYGNRQGYYAWRKSPLSPVLIIGITDPQLTGITGWNPRSPEIQDFVKQHMKPVKFAHLSAGIVQMILGELPPRKQDVLESSQHNFTGRVGDFINLAAGFQDYSYILGKIEQITPKKVTVKIINAQNSQGQDPKNWSGKTKVFTTHYISNPTKYPIRRKN